MPCVECPPYYARCRSREAVYASSTSEGCARAADAKLARSASGRKPSRSPTSSSATSPSKELYTAAQRKA